MSGLDLSGGYFRNATISYSQLVGSSLIEANFESAIVYETEFFEADLRLANFRKARLNFSDFSYANMSDVDLEDSYITSNFRNTNLERANLSNAEIQRADFAGANLTDANFFNSNLRTASFVNTDLRGAQFDQAAFEVVVYDARTEFPDGFSPSEVGMYLLASYSSVVEVYVDFAILVELKEQNLTGMNASYSRFHADFFRATLDQAFFEEANLFRSNFTEASVIDTCFINAHLRMTDLTRADFQGADFRGADLWLAVIDETNFQGAIYNEETRFPEDFDPAAAGAILSDGPSDACSP
ncbi:MAG: pentapeptide repeat-containing protein [Leptolyngbya sp. SIOISBB]|nr:pentapeptide repeat-containing protein [Leptolyngbya sp. SIOISBB]